MITAFLWQEVTCRKCQRTYTSTPEDDHYSADTAMSGLCFPCLLKSGAVDPQATPGLLVTLTGGSTDPQGLSRKPAGGAP